MKILYLSCHSILEHDEILLLHELGHEVFSPGAYVNPTTGGADMRPPLPQIQYDPDIADQWAKHDAVYPERDGKSYLTKEIVDNFDVVICMHIPGWIKSNWHAMRHKRVIWRTIGQSVASTEQGLAQYRAMGLQVVRYSPRERNIPYYIGEDAIIRFYKDPEDYGNWRGINKQVITFAQYMQDRDSACNYSLFERITRQFPRALFGPGNNQPGLGRGQVPFSQLQEEMRENRVYFYTGTHPASYTLNFMEAWMTGIPIVAIGPYYGNANHLRNHDLYEIPDLIQNGVNGFVTDDENLLVSYIKNLMNNDNMARRISAGGRASAIKHFGKETIKAAWKDFLGN